MSIEPSPPAPRRTWFTTVIGMVAILAGGLGSLFSLFALLLAIGKPYANASSDPPGIFLIFILPPGTLLAGIGLLLRHRWARWWMIVLMAALLALGAKGLIAPAHNNPAYTPLPGPTSEAVKRSLFMYSTAAIAAGGLVLLGLFSRPVRREFSSARSTNVPHPDIGESWRVGHCGRDLMFYEERHGHEWRRLEIDGEMLMGRPHHVIYFASPETWQGYPEWARHRREEIIARIKRQFQEPDYEYQETGTIPRAVEPSTALPASAPAPESGGSILPAVLTLFMMAVAAFWFAAESVKSGETRLPARHSGGHTVTSVAKPALFWLSIGVLGTVGTASAGAALWLLVASHRNTATTGKNKPR